MAQQPRELVREILVTNESSSQDLLALSTFGRQDH